MAAEGRHGPVGTRAILKPTPTENRAPETLKGSERRRLTTFIFVFS